MKPIILFALVFSLFIPPIHSWTNNFTTQLPLCKNLQPTQYTCPTPEYFYQNSSYKDCKSDHTLTLECAVKPAVECIGPRTFQLTQKCDFVNGYDYYQSVMLSVLFGYWGADRFYLGYYGTGLLKLATSPALVLSAVSPIESPVSPLSSEEIKNQQAARRQVARYAAFHYRRASSSPALLDHPPPQKRNASQLVGISQTRSHFNHDLDLSDPSMNVQLPNSGSDRFINYPAPSSRFSSSLHRHHQSFNQLPLGNNNLNTQFPNNGASGASSSSRYGGSEQHPPYSRSSPSSSPSGNNPQLIQQNSASQYSSHSPSQTYFHTPSYSPQGSHQSTMTHNHPKNLSSYPNMEPHSQGISPHLLPFQPQKNLGIYPPSHPQSHSQSQNHPYPVQNLNNLNLN